MRISIIGTGYVGLVTGASLAEKGHDVICVDIDPDRVAALNAARSPIFEPGLDELLTRNVGHRLSATTDLAEGWAIDADQYHLVVKGDPSIDTRIRFTPPEHWKNHDWDTMTALPAVSAAFDVKAARPGVLGLKDVGLPTAPAGVWKGR